MRKLLALPWRKMPNPYPNMLYLGLRSEGWKVSFVTNRKMLGDKVGYLGEGDFLHYHWLSHLLEVSKSAAEAEERAALHASMIDTAIAQGAQVIWTVHETISPFAHYPQAQLALSEKLAAASVKIIQLTDATAAAVAPHYALDAAKLATLPHPSYQGLYPPHPAVDPDPAPSVGFFGRLTKEKNLPLLFDAVELARRSLPELQLHVGGTLLPDSGLPADAGYEYIPLNDFPGHFLATDLLVLPDTAALSPNLVHCATSFGKPALLPDYPWLTAEFGHLPWIHFYPAQVDDRAASLAQEIVKLLPYTADHRAECEIAARAYTTYDHAWRFVELLADA
ncbi:MAG: hypothetical protein LBR20_04775 [Propionibacteriaceae bacterium]|jgi:glycosyltransferase involved in cell wall biosynthesis|nr:hypothetical protein [Propionibacteriaceae bacterium]